MQYDKKKWMQYECSMTKKSDSHFTEREVKYRHMQDGRDIKAENKNSRTTVYLHFAQSL